MTNEEAIKYLIAPTATSTEPSAEYLKQKEAYEFAIKALETGEVCMSGEDYNMYLEGYKDAKKDFERSQAAWIPVAERLPEGRIDPKIKDFEYVLCSTTWDDVRPYRFGKRIGENKAHFWLGGAIMDKYITAWRPFPEPYKEA